MRRDSTICKDDLEVRSNRNTTYRGKEHTNEGHKGTRDSYCIAPSRVALWADGTITNLDMSMDDGIVRDI